MTDDKVDTLCAELQAIRAELRDVSERHRIKHDELQIAVNERQTQRLATLTGCDYLAALLVAKDEQTQIEFGGILYDRCTREIEKLGPFRVSGWSTETGLIAITVMLADDLRDDSKWAALPQQMEPIIQAYRSKTHSFSIKFRRPDLNSNGITMLGFAGSQWHHNTMVYHSETCVASDIAIEPVLASIRASLLAMR